MFGDYDDSEMEYDDMAAKERVKDCLERFKLLEQDDSVYFSEEDIEILSNHFFFSGQHNNHVKIVDHGLMLYPNKSSVLLEKAHILSHAHEYEEALDYIKTAKLYEPYNSFILKVEAETLLELDRINEAEESFKLALEYSEFDDEEYVVDIYTSYAQMLCQNNQIKQANQLIEKGLLSYPKNESLYEQLAFNFIAINQYEQAIDYFKKRIDLNPYDHYSWFNLGKFHEITGNKLEAESAYEYATLSSSEAKNAHFNLGALYEEKAAYQLAVDHFLSSFKDQDDLYPYVCAARCYIKAEEPLKARYYLDQAKEMENLISEYLFLKGKSYMLEHDYLKASVFFNSVFKIDKDDFENIFCLFQCLAFNLEYLKLEHIYNNLKRTSPNLILQHWVELAGFFFRELYTDLLEDIFQIVDKTKNYQEELDIVHGAINFIENPSKQNKERLLSQLIHNFEDGIDTLKWFDAELLADEDIHQLIIIYQNQNNE